MIQLKEAFFGAFSPDSSFFAAVGKASRVLLYNENGEQSRFATIPFASAISVSTDSKKLALTSPEHKLCIAKIDGDLIAIRKTEAEASDSLWTPDSSRILIPYWNKELHFVNAESGEIEAVKEIGKSPRLQLGPGGFALTHWRIDEYLHPRIETFDWKLEAISEPIELSTEYSRFGVSQGFNYFWGIGQSGLEVLDKDQKSLFKHPGDVRSAAISPRESEIAFIEASGRITRRKLPTGELISVQAIRNATQPHYSPGQTMLAVTSQRHGALFKL